LAAAAAAKEPPRVVPMPAPPPGPKIRRVVHDAVRPVAPGARVLIRVLAEPGAAVTAGVGNLLGDVPCRPAKGDPGAYECEAVLPAGAAGAAGRHRVRATAAARGRSSTLSAALPVVVDPPDPWLEVNAINARLVPAYFAAGSAEIDAAARAALEKDAEILKAHASHSVLVEGRAEPGEAGDLLDLSRRRSEAARDHLVRAGVPAGRIEVVPLGEAQPLVNLRDAGRPEGLNRVVLILLAPPDPGP
jgi:outer membrane protein OmpA-like peptidoglycan-associated protein